MRAVLDFSEFSDYSEYSEYSDLSKPFRSSLIAHHSSIHLFPPLFNEGLHVGGYFALEVHLFARRRMGEA